MKTTIKNQRAIALLSVLAGVVYFLTLLASVINGHQSGKENVSTYWENKLFKDKKNTSGESPTYRKISLVSNNDFFFSDSVLNLRDNSVIPLNHTNVDVIATEEQPKTLLSVFVFLFQVFTIIFLIPAIFIFPVLFYKLIFSIYKGNIFTADNVRKLNILGYVSLISYVMIVVFAYLDYFERKSIVILENYHIAPPNILGSLHFALIGIIVLIAGQVMKKALLMKEEQDLTI